MTAKELAREFFLGIRTALTCPDVSVTEYEGVMEDKMARLVAAEREACAKLIEYFEPSAVDTAKAIRARGQS